MENNKYPDQIAAFWYVEKERPDGSKYHYYQGRDNKFNNFIYMFRSKNKKYGDWQVKISRTDSAGNSSLVEYAYLWEKTKMRFEVRLLSDNRQVVAWRSGKKIEMAQMYREQLNNKMITQEEYYEKKSKYDRWPAITLFYDNPDAKAKADLNRTQSNIIDSQDDVESDSPESQVDVAMTEFDGELDCMGGVPF